MAITERDRRNLYEQAERSMGKEAADTLMASLPPVGWADVATKQDLEMTRTVLEARMDAGFHSLRADFNEALRLEMRPVRAEVSALQTAMVKQTRWFYGTLFAAAIAIVQRLI